MSSPRLSLITRRNNRPEAGPMVQLPCGALTCCERLITCGRCAETGDHIGGDWSAQLKAGRTKLFGLRDLVTLGQSDLFLVSRKFSESACRASENYAVEVNAGRAGAKPRGAVRKKVWIDGGRMRAVIFDDQCRPRTIFIGIATSRASSHRHRCEHDWRKLAPLSMRQQPTRSSSQTRIEGPPG